MTTPKEVARPPGRARRHASLARFTVLAAVAAVVAAVPVLGLASPAAAHNYLVASTPAADSTLTELPESFVITTNEALLDLGGEGKSFALQVRDSDGLYYGDGCVAVSDASMSSVAAIGDAGEYTVLWQVVSADGHPVSGEYAFTWDPTDASVASTGSAAAPVCGTEPDDSATASPPEDTDDSAAAVADADLGDVIWIGGAIVAVVLAIGVTLFVTGRRKK